VQSTARLGNAMARRYIRADEIQGSALVTLGWTLGDVGAWLLPFWLCVDWFLNLELFKGDGMNKALRTGMDVLAVLWGLKG